MSNFGGAEIKSGPTQQKRRFSRQSAAVAALPQPRYTLCGFIINSSPSFPLLACTTFHPFFFYKRSPNLFLRGGNLFFWTFFPRTRLRSKSLVSHGVGASVAARHFNKTSAACKASGKQVFSAARINVIAPHAGIKDSQDLRRERYFWTGRMKRVSYSL